MQLNKSFNKAGQLDLNHHSSLFPLTLVTRSEACWLIPTCIIRPQTAKDVSKALRVVRFFRTTFAVRSGGHSPNPGFSTLSDPGIMIDLHDLNHISINRDRSVATIEPGNEWIQVYEALDKYGVSVIGGRGPTVGAGGFMLGGLFSTSHLFVSTHVTN
jgi:FAD/FMN-containing dehydrogenase